VTLDGLLFTRLCLESVLAASSDRSAFSSSSPDFEVIVVDNGSTDGTIEYLDELSRRDKRVRVQANGQNAGFAAAVNQGAALARGRVLILLNNDTIVPGNALVRLVDRVADSSIGLLGAVTNRAGNEAEVDVPYRTCGGLELFAREHMQAHSGERFDIRTVTMFCTALRREVWDEIGPLDERFEVGLFEDDDYAMRVRAAGYRVVCAEDVFVHHFGQASIGRLGPTGQYGEVFHANRARWEAKWGVAWQPYERRVKPGYVALVERLRRVVAEVLPPDATVLVVSKGDEELLKLEGRQAWHFPQCEDGTYSGHYPADGEACVAELERLRAKGAHFVILPSTAIWWLDHYAEFGERLQKLYSCLVRDDGTCAIFDLRSVQPHRSGGEGPGVSGEALKGRGVEDAAR
jgi:GT2 family glycosyltransferase